MAPQFSSNKKKGFIHSYVIIFYFFVKTMYLELFLSIKHGIFTILADSELKFAQPFFGVFSVFFEKQRFYEFFETANLIYKCFQTLSPNMRSNKQEMAEINFLATALHKGSQFLNKVLENFFFHFFINFNTWRWECWDQNFNLGLRSAKK